MLPHISKGDFVWLDSSLAPLNGDRQWGPPLDFPAVAARVLATWHDPQGGEHILLLDDQGNKLEFGSLELQRWAIRPMHPTSIQGVPDLVHMVEVHEAALLRTLQIRFRQRIFHTSIGPRLLLSVCPSIRGVTNSEERLINLYGQRRHGRHQHQLSPHIYAIGADLLNLLVSRNPGEEISPRAGNEDSCVIFTGESGAGKSESAGQLMEFLLAQNFGNEQMEAKIKAANLLIKAFANAKTACNGNSSRHGKYMELQYAASDGAQGQPSIVSAHIELFLLEKARVVEAGMNASGNSNFHVFYALLAGANSQQKLELELTNDRVSSYRLLQASQRHNTRAADFVGEKGEEENNNMNINAIELFEIVSAMRTLMFREAEIEAIWRLLAAILHLGNLRYNVRQVDGIECLDLHDKLNLQRIGRLLKIDEMLLTSTLNGNYANFPVENNANAALLSIEEVVDLRDHLIKEIYANLVDHIVHRVNEALVAPAKAMGRKETKIGNIGLLDFPGLENDVKYGNNFEQLCQNYAAECVQQFYVRRVFKLEQAEYEAQALPDWEPGCVSYVDNLAVLEMLAVQPSSVMSVLDDVCILPNATDEELLAKLHSAQSDNERLYQRPKSELVKQFAVRHHTGIVQYKVRGMVQKNRNCFPVELCHLLASSQLKFLCRLFNPNDGQRKFQLASEAESRLMKQQTECTKIRRRMDSLMGRLERCENVFFVRCLKANDGQKEGQFDPEAVLRQIRQFDVLSAVEMCRAGFPMHMDYAQFVRQYRPLVQGIPPAHLCHCLQAARHICHTVFGQNSEFVQFGKSKLFLKADQHQSLEMMRERRLRCCAQLVQKCLQGWAKRQQFRRLQAAAIIFQKNWRALAERRRFQKILRGITRLQALIRAHQLVVRYQWLRSNVTKLQAHCRAALLRQQLRSLPSRAERHRAMMARLDWQMHSEGEAPALELHGELDNLDYSDANFGALHLVKMDNADLSSSIHPPSDVEADEKKNWNKFAIAHFQQLQCTPGHSRALLRRSLLTQPKPMDELLAIAVWRRLLQLMGDIAGANPDSNRRDGNHCPSKVPAMARLKAVCAKEYSPTELQHLHAELMDQPMESNAGLRKATRTARNVLVGEQNCLALEKIHFILCAAIHRPNLQNEIYSQLCKQLNGNPSATSARRGWTLLTICASIFHPSDQMAPYLLNFVHKNAPNPLVAQQIVHSLGRTHKVGPRREPILMAELACAVHQSGTSLAVDIQLPDQRTIAVPVDSQSTAGELCAALASRIGLDDAFGFGLFLSAGPTVRALGAGPELVMDALAQAEQQQQQKAGTHWQLFFRKEIFRPFRSDQQCPIAADLAYKQVVRGLHLGEYQCEKEDELAHLAAQQHFIVSSRSNGVDGHRRQTLDVSELEESLADYLPTGTFLVGPKEGEEEQQEEDTETIKRQKWLQLVMHAYRKKIVKSEEFPLPSVDHVRQQFLQFAAQKWPLLFSRFFEVFKFSGPPLASNQLTLAVNSTGIFVLDSRDEQLQRILREISYIQLAAVGFGRSKHQGAEAVSLQLLNGERFTFQSAQAHEVCQLVSYMLQGLRQQSQFAVALEEQCPGTTLDNNSRKQRGRNREEGLLQLSRGDLLILDAPFGQQLAIWQSTDFVESEEACKEDDTLLLGVENTRTGLRGKVPMGAVQMLACTEKPSKDQLEALLLSANNKATPENTVGNEESAVGYASSTYEYPAFFPLAPFGIPVPIIGNMAPPPHTLERFAADNFRPSQQQKTIDTFASIQRTDSLNSHDGGGNELWRHSRQPLQAPLLKTLASASAGKEEMLQESLLSYSFMLKYMGDQPHPQQYYVEHTDHIFAAPLKYELLRDETYCQLMKQLTDNLNPLSEERGWELMWLCLGLFLPSSKALRRELAHFLRSRYVLMAADCAIRLQKALSECADTSAECRRFPPHQVELEAIRHRQTQIFHKYHLPDGSQDRVELESWTRAREFGARVATQIGLSATQGFSLFVKMGEKVVCIPEHEFFFDFMHQLQDWALKSGRRRNGGVGGIGGGQSMANFNYQVHFMRKLWLDVEPGQNPREDLIFNYHQELPKYLRGYHRVDKHDAVQLGAFVLRAQTKDEKQPPVQHIQHILPQLVPKDLLKAHSPNEWKQLISAQLNGQGMPKCSAEAKLAFLQQIAREPTFGSAFFEVKQSADPTMCSKLLVAINRHGMSLYEQENKRHICTYAFEQISHWQPANTYFHITLDKGNRLLFETTLGHKLDDLLTSYIQTLILLQEKATGPAGRHQMGPAGNIINGKKKMKKTQRNALKEEENYRHQQNLPAIGHHRECA